MLDAHTIDGCRHERYNYETIQVNSNLISTAQTVICSIPQNKVWHNMTSLFVTLIISVELDRSLSPVRLQAGVGNPGPYLYNSTVDVENTMSTKKHNVIESEVGLFRVS